jgi:hypothetical protein
MRAYVGSGGKIRYFKCDSCRRWLSSTYQDVLRADAHFRACRADEDAGNREQFESVKARLERWLAGIEEQDPYRLLGVSPMDSDDKVRRRYRELALEAHPDRGGSVEKMRDINLAYEKIVTHRERARKQEQQHALEQGEVAKTPPSRQVRPVRPVRSVGIADEAAGANAEAERSEAG